eukprot:scaffold16899_cov97-Isochrysis_galbana.AAC.3
MCPSALWHPGAPQLLPSTQDTFHTFSLQRRSIRLSNQPIPARRWPRGCDVHIAAQGTDAPTKEKWKRKVPAILVTPGGKFK